METLIATPPPNDSHPMLRNPLRRNWTAQIFSIMQMQRCCARRNNNPPFGTPVLPDVYKMMAINWSDGVLDKVAAVSKFALLRSPESFLNLPKDIEAVAPKASTLATATGHNVIINTGVNKRAPPAAVCQ